MTLHEILAGQDESRWPFDVLQAAIEAINPVDLWVSKCQVAFHRRVAFAWAWMLSQCLRRLAAPLVLILSSHQRDPSLRWKSILESYSVRFTQHLEPYTIEEIDAQVRHWMQQAWEAAA